MPDSFAEMRRRNAVRVLDLVRSHGELSRADLARLADLSKATVSSIIAELIDLDLLRETGTISTEKGRKPVGLVFNADGRFALGISVDDQNVLRIDATDMNGKSMHAISVSLQTVTLPTAQTVLQKVSSSCAEWGLDLAKVCAVGIAVPGPVDGDERARKLVEGVSTKFHLNVPIETLVDMAALAEAEGGSLPSDSLILFVRTSHRLRSTLLYSKVLLSRHSESGGEPGHVIVPWIKDQCGCGKIGCANSHIGSQNILQRAEKREVKVGSVGELVALADGGNEVARELIRDAGRATGFAIAGLINVLSPLKVVITGALTTAKDVYFAPLMEAAKEYSMDGNFEASNISLSTQGAHSASIGAAVFALSRTESLLSLSLRVTLNSGRLPVNRSLHLTREESRKVDRPTVN